MIKKQNKKVHESLDFLLQEEVIINDKNRHYEIKNKSGRRCNFKHQLESLCIHFFFVNFKKYMPN